MTTDNFCYWLQGFFEMTDTDKLTKKQIGIIKDHLKLVFDKQTPNYDSAGTLTVPPPWDTWTP